MPELFLISSIIFHLIFSAVMYDDIKRGRLFNFSVKSLTLYVCSNFIKVVFFILGLQIILFFILFFGESKVLLINFSGIDLLSDLYTSFSKILICGLTIISLMFSRVFIISHNKEILEYPILVSFILFFSMILLSAVDFFYFIYFNGGY